MFLWELTFDLRAWVVLSSHVDVVWWRSAGINVVKPQEVLRNSCFHSWFQVSSDLRGHTLLLLSSLCVLWLFVFFICPLTACLPPFYGSQRSARWHAFLQEITLLWRLNEKQAFGCWFSLWPGWRNRQFVFVPTDSLWGDVDHRWPPANTNRLKWISFLLLNFMSDLLK